MHLLFFASYMYRSFIYLIYEYLSPSWIGLINIVVIAAYFIILIPIVAFIAEKVSNLFYSEDKKVRGGATILLALLIITPITLFSIEVIDDTKEKNLADLISFKPETVDYMLINFDVKLDKKEQAEQLQLLLNKYDVKKMKDRDWDEDVSREKGFTISIYSNGKPLIVSLYENRLLLTSGDVYRVMNGPIDFGWFDTMYEEGG